MNRSAWPSASPREPAAVVWDALLDAPVGTVFGIAGGGLRGALYVAEPGKVAQRVGERSPMSLREQIPYWKSRGATLYLVRLGGDDPPAGTITRAINSAQLPEAGAPPEARPRPAFTSEEIARVIDRAWPKRAPRPALHRPINVVDAAIFAWITRNVDPLQLHRSDLVELGMRARGVKPTGKAPGTPGALESDPSGNVRMFWDGVWEKPWGKSFGEDTHRRVLAENAAKVRDEMILRAYGLDTAEEMEQRTARAARHLLQARSEQALSADLEALQKASPKFTAQRLSKRPALCALAKGSSGWLLGPVHHDGGRDWRIGQQPVGLTGSAGLHAAPINEVRALIAKGWAAFPPESLPSNLRV